MFFFFVFCLTKGCGLTYLGCAYVCTSVSPNNSRYVFNILEALALCFCANLSLVLPAYYFLSMPYR